MNMKDKIEPIKKKFEQLKRKHRFKKENDKRKQEAQLTKDLVDCAGDLGLCRSNYERSIRQQSEQIRQGMAEGYPVTVQKNLLMDAAVGYMLVCDALFVIRSVASYDSIVQAYDLLDAATRTITGEKAPLFSGIGKGKKKPVREEYDFINADETVEAKKKIVTTGGFMEMLIETGNIDKCISTFQEQGSVNTTPQGLAVPLEPQLEESNRSAGFSDEDRKLLAEMKKSTGWNISTPFVSTSDIGTNTQTPSMEGQDGNDPVKKTGGGEQ